MRRINIGKRYVKSETLLINIRPLVRCAGNQTVRREDRLQFDIAALSCTADSDPNRSDPPTPNTGTVRPKNVSQRSRSIFKRSYTYFYP